MYLQGAEAGALKKHDFSFQEIWANALHYLWGLE